MFLSAALITRDEEHHLPDCLASVVGVVDEIVVVDTGSMDHTADIARSFGARIVEFPWRDDFAAARNAGLEVAHGEWILAIDADERLAVHGDLETALADPDAVAGLVRFRTASTHTQYLEYRFFRNRPDIRFRGSMHETIAPDVLRAVETEGKTVLPLPVAIEHVGYEGDLTHKHRRNLPLLERELINDPERTLLWFHLGAVRLALDDPVGAEQAWERAIDICRDRGEISSAGLLAFVQVASCRMRDHRSAADLISELEREHPDDPLTIWLSAGGAMFEERWHDAIRLLESLLTIDTSAIVHPELAYSLDMFDAQALHALGTCWFHLGDNVAAAELFGRAEASDPTNDEYRVKRRLAEARAARG